MTDTPEAPRTESAAAELLPCPCCGSAAEIGQLPFEEDSPDAGGYFVRCTNDGCLIGMGLRFACGDDPRPELIASWNTRALPFPAPSEAREAGLNRSLPARAARQIERNRAAVHTATSEPGALWDLLGQSNYLLRQIAEGRLPPALAQSPAAPTEES